MPNIIEQQDLLKGLPDDRLSMLMQNPTGDIPPFLVAAEAQRRQSIREQFSGGPQESVVDTLTKQIASVPQNIQAPMQEPPQMPPPQMQAGVGALQQTARDGGLMRRFASLGYVRPSTDVNALAEDLANMTPEELEAKRLAESNERMRIANERRHILGGRGGIGTAAERQSLESIINGPFSFFYDPQERIDAAKKLVKMPTQEEMEQTLQTGEPAYKPGTSEPYRYGMSASDRSSAPGYKPRNEESGQNDTSEENQDAATKAALRKRLEELYGERAISGAEKAEKWFAMAQNFFKRGQSFGESIANAGAIYSQGAAEEKAAQREADIAREKALLEWDMAQYDAERRSRAEIASDELAYQRELAKMRMLSPGDAIRGYSAQIEDLMKRLEDTAISEDERASVNSEISGLRIAIANIMKNAGYGAGGVDNMNTMRQLAAGQ
jgi:hypothetical protein